MRDLTPKQARFVGEYLIDLNAAQAAIRAGYSEKSAKQQGSRLFTNADVQAAVATGSQPELRMPWPLCAAAAVVACGRVISIA